MLQATVYKWHLLGCRPDNLPLTKPQDIRYEGFIGLDKHRRACYKRRILNFPDGSRLVVKAGVTCDGETIL